jgi:energy-coupling factor transporter transmembrane protein EcfT
MNENPKSVFEDIVADLKEYIAVRKEYHRLNIIEKISLSVSFFMIVLLCMGAFFFAFIYFSVALVFLFEKIFGSFVPALFLVCGINLLIIALIILFRKSLFFSPMIRLVSKFLK